MLNKPRVLAHPLTEPFQLPVSPLVSAWAVTALVLLAAFLVEQGRPRPNAVSTAEVASWTGRLSTPQVATRLVAVLFLVACIVAGRLGTEDELENLAPALVVGAGWPLLVLATALVGPVWRWLDPWDTVARALGGSSESPTETVWPAVVVALPWVWYLSAYQDTLEPRSVGALLAVYTIVTLGGCLVVGRRRWLASGEPLGIILAWIALLPRGRLVRWAPPRGAEALLGVLAGGILFGAARRSELWGSLNTSENADLLAALGVLAASAAGAGLVMGMAAIARVESPAAGPAAARALVPALAGIIVAVAMDRNRLTTSIQLLPDLFGDPLGRGWDLFGRAASGLDAAPFGVRGLLLAQLGVLAAAHIVGAAVQARGLPRTARVPIALGLGLLANLSVLAVATH
jgi:hypothetical protein